MRMSERRGDANSGVATPAGDGGDNRRLLVRAAVDGDGLAGGKARRVNDRDRGRAHFGGGARGSGARGPNRCDDDGLDVRAGIDQNRLTGSKVRYAGDFDIGRAGGRTNRQRGSGLQPEIGAVTVGVGAVRKPSRAPIGRTGAWSALPPEATAADAGRGHVAATLP